MQAQITHYLDLKAIPQEDMTEDLIISELMERIHRLLVSTDLKGQVGVGFPNYNLNKRLGGIIRIFSSEKILFDFEKAVKTDSVIRDYSIVTDSKRVPEQIDKHVVFSRLRPETISNSQVKRYQKRNPEKWTEIFSEQVLESRELLFGVPHFKMNSGSSKQHFIIWVKRQERAEKIGRFGSYGLSNTATVPVF